MTQSSTEFVHHSVLLTRIREAIGQLSGVKPMDPVVAKTVPRIKSLCEALAGAEVPENEKPEVVVQLDEAYRVPLFADVASQFADDLSAVMDKMTPL